MFSFLKLLLPLAFGSSSNGKGIVTSVSDAVEKWFPSAETKNKRQDNALESHENSQNKARKMKMKSHDSWLDILIDAWIRSMRPLITTGLIGIWFGWWSPPVLDNLDPFYIDMTMIILTFWFGGRFATKDLPKARALWLEAKRKYEDDEDLSGYDDDYEDPIIDNSKLN